ncbi:MAG: hypothetical protein B6D64_10165 [Bacteroidetes bacterium 4484_276]|nr:MAG: hypothetical protein B6D64_10165 [Bacteroidetes bacterium 4484_276]
MNNLEAGINFLGVGTAKAGTTTMFYILKDHPQIFLPSVKEIQFFDRNYDNGMDWYFKHFKETQGQKAIGEITPNYMYDAHAPKRILKHLGPDVKLIFILRNPADRAYSNYLMNYGRKTELQSFEDAFNNDLKRMDTSEVYDDIFHYVKKGFYDVQIKRMLKSFSKKNMLFLLFEEDFLKHRKKSFNRIYDFLGVERLNISVDKWENPSKDLRIKNIDGILDTPNPINQFAKAIIPNKNARVRLKYFIKELNRKKRKEKTELENLRGFIINNQYKESIINLEKLIDRDLSAWLNF